jgi:hypothetical protein
MRSSLFSKLEVSNYICSVLFQAPNPNPHITFTLKKKRVKMLVPIHPFHFLLQASHIVRRVHGGHLGLSNKVFAHHFGVPPIVCSDVWRKATFPIGVLPVHLLWALMFLKTYLTETILCTLLRTTEKTFRKWVWAIIDSIKNIAPCVVRRRDINR